jgi:iron complex outermembrane receptor protein
MVLQRVVVYGLGVALLQGGSLGWAQQRQAAPASGPVNEADEPQQLQEVVVTAEKRASTVQKTPISMSAVSGEELQTLGISAAQGIAQAVPGMAVASAGPGEAQYEIRGVSADGGEAPTVGFYLNEIPITPPTTATIGKSAIDPDLYDLVRVEVLRGPQGTLYGAGSMGGTIKLVTAPPDMSGFYSTAQSALSDTQGGGINYAEKGMLNLPLMKDVLALRIVGTYDHTSGWIDRVVVPDFPLESAPAPNLYGTGRGNVLGVPGSQVFHNVNDEQLTSGRATLLFTPNEFLSITPAILHQEITQGGMNTYDQFPGTLAHYQPFDVPEPFADRFTLVSLTAVANLEPFSITSATGYWTRRSTQQQDASEQFQNAFQLPGYSIADGGLGSAFAYEDDDTRQFSQELRFASADSGALQWLIGGYYSQYTFTIDTGAIGTDILSAPTPPLPIDNLFHVYSVQHIKQTAAFGNISYRLATALKLTLGGRYFSFTNSIQSSSSGIAGPTGTDTPALSAGAAAASGVNPMANLAYSASDNLMLYATAAKGFREGAGNFPVETTGAIGQVCLQNLEAIGRTSSPTLYDPDQVWSYEIGQKGRYLDQRLTVNADVYFLRWTRVQQPVALACGLTFVENAGAAQVKGGELELKAVLLPQLVLSQNVGYSSAYFTESVPEAGVVNGQSLLNVPRWTLSTELRYEHRLLSDLRATATATNSYISSQQDLTYSLNTLPARDLVGMRLGLDSTRWSAELFVDNVADRHYPIEYINLLTFTGPPYNRIATNQPRTIGVSANFRF